MSKYKQDHIVEANKKVSSVEWLSNQSYELFEQYSEGNFDRITLNKLMLKATEQAKAMHKEEIENAYLTCYEEYTAEGKHWEMGMNPKETFDEYYKENYESN